MPKTESLVVYAMPDIASKFQKDPSITFRVILLTHRQTDKQSPQKHNLLGGGNYTDIFEGPIQILGMQLFLGMDGNGKHTDFKALSEF